MRVCICLHDKCVQPAPTPCATKFDFRRLGLRTSGMLMSPYIPAGAVFQEPHGPYPDSQFDLSSVVATAKHLFGVPGFLTRRDAWAGSFHELLTLTTPRTDAPMHLPDGPPIHAERERERRRLQQLEEENLNLMGSEEAAAAATDGEEQSPRHCSSSAAAAASATSGGECAADGDSVTQKQRNRIILSRVAIYDYLLLHFNT